MVHKSLMPSAAKYPSLQVASQEVDLMTLRGALVEDLGAPPFQFDEHGDLQGVTQVAPVARVPPVGRQS